MKVGARPILVFHRDREFVARIHRLGSRSYTIQSPHSWSALHSAVVAAPPSALVVVDPYAGENGDGQLASGLRGLLVDFPSLPVFAAIEAGRGRRDDLRTMGKWGLVEVISIGHDDTAAALLHRFRKATGRPLKMLLDGVLPRDTPSRARAIIDAAAETVTVAGQGSDLARLLGLSRRTLLRWTEDAGLPPPRTLLAWMRILLAAELLDDPGRSVLAVAQACGYSSDSGLRRVMQRFVGASPTQLRDRGAFARASKTFLEQLARFQHIR